MPKFLIGAYENDCSIGFVGSPDVQIDVKTAPLMMNFGHTIVLRIEDALTFKDRQAAAVLLSSFNTDAVAKGVFRIQEVPNA